MSLHRFLMKIPVIEDMYIQKILDDECEKYFNRIEDVKDGFLRKFLLQIINCGKVGVYELFTYVKRNIVNIRASGDAGLRSYFHSTGSLAVVFKWISLYHISRFLRENTNEIDNSVIFSGITGLFLLSDADYNSLVSLAKIPADNAVEYEIKFSSLFISRALQQQTNTPVMLALIDNFFYNSYNDFISSFTNYVSIGSIAVRK